MKINVIKKIVATAFIVVATIPCSASVQSAISEKDNLEKWIISMPEIIDGVKIFPFVEDDKEIRISEIIDFPEKSKDIIFVNLYENIRRNFNDEYEDIDNIDIDGRKILIHRKVKDTELSGVTYEYSIALQATDNMLLFLIYNINIGYREKGVLPRTLPIVKFNPQENRRHKELIEGFSVSIAKFLNDYIVAVNNAESQSVSHWKEISRNEVVPGMNSTEVILSYGMPNSERKTGSRTKWMYGNENVVIFTDGVVSTVI